MHVTIYDVAKRAGVAASTVSKYINHGVLRTEVRQRVEEAITALNYVPNDIARGLKNLKSFTIGVIIPTFDSSFTSKIISEIEKKLQEFGYGMLVCDCHGLRKTELEKLAFLKQKSVDAYIVLPSALTAEDLKGLNKPVVLFDKPIENFPTDTVLIDNEKAGYLATKYLLNKGHENIAVLLGQKGLYTSDLRYKGFLKAYEEFGLTPDPASKIHTDYTLNNSYDQTLKFMQSGNRSTAILATNSDTTMGCVMALNYLGVSVPSKISVVGFDNLVMSKISNPSVTIIYQPLEKLGLKIAELLLNRIGGNRSDPITEIMDTELIEGSSVKNLFE